MKKKKRTIELWLPPLVKTFKIFFQDTQYYRSVKT